LLDDEYVRENSLTQGGRVTVRRTAILLATCLWLGLVCTASAQGSLVWSVTAGPAGGFVNTLALVPNTPGMIYAGSDSGVYLTRDDGARWSAVSQGLPANPLITALVVLRAPNVVLAGTHNGIYRTSDAGATWTSVDPRQSHQIIHAFLLDPATPQRIYAATANTVLRSDNAGDTWNDVGADLKSTRVWSLAFSLDGQTLYAVTDTGIYASRDRGERWQFISEGLPGGVRPQSIVVTTRGLLVGTSQGIYQSPDGKSWNALGGSLAQAFARPVVNDPQQPDRVFVVLPQGIARTTDGGMRWSLLPNPLRDLPIRSLALADKHTIYVGTARGVLKSSDDGATWQILNTGFVATTVNQLMMLPTQPALLLAATTFGVYRSSDRGNTWSEARGLTDPYVVCLARDPSAAGEIYAGTWSSAVFVSRDSGATFTLVAENLSRSAPISSLLIVASDGQTVLYAGTLGNGLFKSTDKGQTWHAQTNGLNGITRVIALVATPTHLYAATERGVYRLPRQRTEAAWEYVASLPLDEANTLVFDPRRPQTLITGFTSSGIYRSDDGGTRWSPRGALPMPARLKTVALNPALPDVIYAGTDRGVFRSEDGGTHWTLANDGLPPYAIVQTMVVDPNAPEHILAGTTGSGVVHSIESRRSIISSPAITSLVLLGCLGFGLMGLLWYRYWSPPAQERALRQMWKQWEAAIAQALQKTGEAHAGNLKLPRQQLSHALKRYLAEHPREALTWQEHPPYLRADNFAMTQRFLSMWKAAWELVDNEQAFASVTRQIVDQLCILLGFTRLDERAYKGLMGYVVRAPALRLKIPPRFPIIFIPRREARAEDVAALRDLMGVLNMVSYFALVIDLRDTPPPNPRQALAHLLRQATHDFIVLDGHALRRLLAARDHSRELVEIILSQVDLTVVSPYVTSGPVPANMFFGREAELKTIVRTVRDTNFAIVGGRKIGKTSILARVLHLLQEIPEYHPFYLDCQAVHSYEDFFETVETMWRLELPARTPEAFRRVITDLPTRYPLRTIVMLFDEIDGLLAYDIERGESLFRVFRALSQELALRFVFCGDKVLNNALHNPHLAFFNFCNRMVLSYLRPEEARRVVTDPMHEMGVVLEEDGDLAAQIIDYAACHPNMVQYLCQKLIERINQRRERLIRRSDVESVGRSTEYAEYFAEVLWGSTTSLERLITLWLLERNHLTLGETAQTLDTAGVAVPLDHLEEAFESLTLYSILRREGPQYTFAAPALARVLRRGTDVYGSATSYLEELRTLYGVKQ